MAVAHHLKIYQLALASGLFEEEARSQIAKAVATPRCLARVRIGNKLFCLW